MRLRSLIWEGDVVDFPGKKPKVPDSLKYAAAADAQSGTPSTSVSDYARSIILRNLDKIFSGQPLPDEDRKVLNDILDINSMVTRMQRRSFVTKVIDLYRKSHPGTDVYLHMPDAAQAYIKDDPTLALTRLQVGNAIKTFDHPDDADLYVLQNLLGDTNSFDDSEKADLGRFIDRLTNPPRGDRETGDTARFDPDARPFWMGQPDDKVMIPSIEKYLKQFERGSDKDWHIWFSTYDGPPTLNFTSRHGKPRKLVFDTLPELEQWVLSHKAEIDQWARDQAAGVRPDDAAATQEIVNGILDMYRQILSGQVDEKVISDRALELYGDCDYLQNKSVRELLVDCLMNLRRPTLWQFISEYHLTWLPEQVAERSKR